MRHALRSLACLAALASLAPSPAAGAQAARSEPIVGGRPAGLAELRSTVGVLDASTLAVVCTGTLVRPRVVVTAGHCFFDEDFAQLPATAFVVAFGALDLRSPPSASNLVPVVSGGPHPDYGVGPVGDETRAGLDPTERDIGVLILGRDLLEVAQAPLMTEGETREVAGVGAELVIAGYGVTDLDTLDYGVLMQASATVLDRIPNELLIGPTTSAQGDTCFGDSGGPVYGVFEGRSVLVGLTSRGRLDTTVECGAGGVYTNVAYHREFLASVTGDETLAPPRASSGRCGASPSGSPAGTSLAAVALVVAALAVRVRARPIRGC